MSNNIALLIIDTQLNMFADDFSVHQGEELLQTLNGLIAKARESETAVIFVRNNGPAGEPDEPHTPGWEIHPSLATLPNDIILDKNTPDTFASTNLQEILATRKITSLIIGGVQTEICVQSTTQQAIDLGYHVTLVIDGHSTFDFPDEPPATEQIKRVNQRFATEASLLPAAKIEFG